MKFRLYLSHYFIFYINTITITKISKKVLFFKGFAGYSKSALDFVKLNDIAVIFSFQHGHYDDESHIRHNECP